MRRPNLVALLLPLALFPPCPAAAQAPDTRSGLGANAAMKYWQAFALLPTLDEDQAKLLQNWKEVPIYDESAAFKLIDASRMSRVYLHRGAKLERCDWSLDDEDGPGLFMSHCPRSLNLARLALLHARHEFEQGHWQGGWEDVTDVLKLGRHVGVDPQLVVRWVAYRIETHAIEAAAPYLPELKPIIPEVASAVLDTLPAGPTLQQMVLEEKRTGLMWEIQELRKAEQRKEGSWRGVWRNLVDPPWLESQNRDLALVQSVTTFDQAIKRLEDLLPFYDELARVIALPWKEFDAQYPELVKKAKARDLWGFDRLNEPDGIVARVRRYETQMALFKAALAVVKGGPDKLKDIEDPFGNGPFEFRALDRGFELKSKLLFKGQPVMLTVGQGMKR
jgi:hypothetical protein